LTLIKQIICRVSFFYLLLALCFPAVIQLGIVGNVFAATDVTSITASPNPFNPTNGETTTVTVEATPSTGGVELLGI